MDPLVAVVFLKAVRRVEISARLDAEGRGPRPEEAPLALNPADAQALRVALAPAWVPPGRAPRVIAVTVAPEERVFPLRLALAAGADAAIRVWGRDWPPDLAEGHDGSANVTAAMGRAGAAAIAPLRPGLVLTGERSADLGHECFGAYLAHELRAGFAHRVGELTPTDGGWEVVARLDRGYGQRMTLPAPLVATITAAGPPLPDPPLPAWLAALRREIPLVEPALPAPAPGQTTFRAPVPRVMAYALPDPGLDAEGRIRAMVTHPTGGEGRVLGAEIPPHEQAEALAALLREKGYLG